MSISKDEAEKLKKMSEDPLFFCEVCWGMKVERDNDKFVRGENLSWQQEEIFRAMKDGLDRKSSRRISIRAGRGVAKTATMAMSILWGLYRTTYLSVFNRDGGVRIVATAPTEKHLFEKLWQEANKWLNKIKIDGIREMYEWKKESIDIGGQKVDAFASAIVGRKENAESVAGTHATFVMFIADEASGIPDEILKAINNGLTDVEWLFVMISNPRKRSGFFHNSYTVNAGLWNCLHFSNLDSPLANPDLAESILNENNGNKNCYDYRVEVLGLPPTEDMIDDDGWMTLLGRDDIQRNIGAQTHFSGVKKLGVDPSGEGDNETLWVLRDNGQALVVGKEQISSSMSIAAKTITIIDRYEINPQNVWVDNFGEGANVAVELAKFGKNVNSVNVNERSDDEQYMNKRAEAFLRMREAIKKGLVLVGDGWDQLEYLYFRTNPHTGKKQIMDKKTMRRRGIDSPDQVDALMLTFFGEDRQSISYKDALKRHRTIYGSFDAMKRAIRS